MLVLFQFVKYSGHVTAGWMIGKRSNRAPLLDSLCNYGWHCARAVHQTNYQQYLLIRAINRCGWVCTRVAGGGWPGVAGRGWPGVAGGGLGWLGVAGWSGGS